jgi:hypothetical protein
MRINALTCERASCMTVAWLFTGAACSHPKLAVLLPAALCMLIFQVPTLMRGADGLADLLERGRPLPHSVQQDVSMPSAQRLPVPGEDALRRSAKNIREIFGADVRTARTPEAKSVLAAAFLRHAAETADATDRYLLLESARTFAEEGGDANTALDAIDQIAKAYEIDMFAAKQALLISLATKAPVTTLGTVIDTLFDLASAANDRGDVEAAEELAKAAASAARRSRDRDRQKVAADWLGELKGQKKLATQAKALVDRLSRDPTDREAAADLGRFRCFQESKWAEGLPLLAEGADASLAALAKAELNSSGTPSDLMSLADAWANHAETAKGVASTSAKDRARLHYTQALGSLTGLDRARVLKRLESLGPAGAGKRPKGLVLWLDASASGALRGTDGQVFDKNKAEPMPVAEWLDVAGGTALARTPPRVASAVATAQVFGRNPAVVFSERAWLESEVSASDQGTLIVVCKPFTVTNMRLIGCQSTKPGIRMSFRGTGAAGFEVARSETAYDGQGAPAGSIAKDTPLVLAATWPKPYMFRLNGKAFETGLAPAHSLDGGGTLIFGACNEKGFEPFAGAVGEIRIYDRVLSLQELTSLEGELAAKWQVGR